MNPTRPLIFAVLVFAGAARAADHQIHTEYRNASLSAVEVENLVGAVKLLPSEGNELLIEYTVVAGAKDDAAARALADMISFKTTEHDGRLSVHIVYPLDQYRTYYYDGPGDDYQTNTQYQGRQVRVTSRGSDGVELHVDVIAHLPKGYRARFANAVGEIAAAGVDGDLDLDTGSGGIDSRDGRGRFRGDTGSGAITVRDHQGDIEADTGSGEIEVVGLVGDVDADTGSGQIVIRKTKATRIKANTGSGRVTVEDSSGSLDADTGSGGVFTRNFIAGERLRADTGSGGVQIEGDLSAVRDLDIDTGSGGATVRTSKPMNLRLDIDASSGAVRVDYPDMRDVQQDDGAFSATLGSGAGRATIDTGSGGVRFELVR